MQLKKRLSKEITISAVILALTILVVSISFFTLNNSLHGLILESEPTQEAMEHMVQDVYRDNIVLLEYLNTDSYTSATSLDTKVEESNEVCSQVGNNIENLIITGAMSNRGLISDYEHAYQLHSKVEDLRDQIIDLHKEELATKRDLSSQKRVLLENHSVALALAVDAFSETAQEIEKNNDLLKAKILWQSKVYTIIIIVLILIFIIVTHTKMKKISSEVIEPIDHTITATRKFVEGNYESKISPTNKFTEISDLQNNINNVFTVVKNESRKNTEKRDEIDVQLLRKEYIQILKFVKHNTMNNVKTNISDLKKHLNVTHPTILERLHYLEHRGFITVHKEGREKFLHVTKKF